MTAGGVVILVALVVGFLAVLLVALMQIAHAEDRIARHTQKMLRPFDEIEITVTQGGA